MRDVRAGDRLAAIDRSIRSIIEWRVLESLGEGRWDRGSGDSLQPRPGRIRHEDSGARARLEARHRVGQRSQKVIQRAPCGYQLKQALLLGQQPLHALALGDILRLPDQAN